VFASPPNQADYTTFLGNTLPPLPGGGVTLPSADVITTTLQIAQDSVNDFIQCASSTLYVEAVYNLAADAALYLATDAPGQTYFVDTRRKLRLGDLSVGVIAAASNQATSMGQVNPRNLQELTLAELRLLKTSYGRRYIEIAQAFGSGLFGVS